MQNTQLIAGSDGVFIKRIIMHAFFVNFHFDEPNRIHAKDLSLFVKSSNPQPLHRSLCTDSCRYSVGFELETRK